MGVGFFSAFFWDPAGGGGKGGMPWDELTADIAVEVFFNDEAMYLYAMNRNDHQQKPFLEMKHQLPHGGRQTVLVKNLMRIMQPNS